MESFLKDFAAEMGLTPGQPFHGTFAEALKRYLERTRIITIKEPFSKEKPVRQRLTDEQLGPEGVAAYNRALESIKDSEIGRLPLSPIDWIKFRIQEAGFSVGEITGRGLIVDYSTETPTLQTRSGTEITPAGRRRAIDGFNSGKLDALVINQAGATGLSLHASVKFKDQSPRHMILAQAEANIDTHMQMLGRVNRTGQVKLPRYSQLVADVPAEKRPAAVLAKKMASLNANTTASRKGALSAEDVPDFMNEYGDQVAVTLLRDDEDLNERIGSPLSFDEKGKVTTPDPMRKVTGRIPLLPINEQEELYALLEAEYQTLLDQMEMLGENALEAKTMDLDARTLEAKEVVPKKPNDDSPFADGVRIETVDVKRVGKPYSSIEVVELAAKAVDLDLAETMGATTNENAARRLQIVQEKASADRTYFLEDTIEEFNEYRRGALEKAAEQDSNQKLFSFLLSLEERWHHIINTAGVGQLVTFKTAVNGNFTGVIIKVERTGKTKNPLALSAWKATLAVPDASRQIVVPFSRLHTSRDPVSGDDESLIEVAPAVDTPAHLLPLFDRSQQEVREKRLIAVGNVLAGYNWLNRQGQIVNYTTEDGDIRPGVLLKRGFNLEKFEKGKPVYLETVAQIEAFLHPPNRSVTTEDGFATLQQKGWNYVLTAVGAKSKGGKYYLDAQLIAATDTFHSKSGSMHTKFDAGKLQTVVERIHAIGGRFIVKGPEKDAAQAIVKAAPATQKPPDGTAFSMTPSGRATVSGLSVSEAGPLDLSEEGRSAAQALAQEIAAIVERIAGPGVRVSLENRIVANDPDAAAASGGRVGEGAGGQYVPAEALIRLAVGDPTFDPRNEAGHEAWHHLEFSGLVSEPERQVLQREQPRLREIAARELGTTPEALAGMPNYEVNAIAFAAYRRMREEGQAPFGFHTGVRRVFERIMNIIRSIRNLFQGLGFDTADSIFERARRGEMTARTAQPAAGTPATAYAMRGHWLRAPPNPPPGTFDRPDMSASGVWMDRTRSMFARVTGVVDVARFRLAKKLADRFKPMQRYQRAVETSTGTPVPEHQDVYLAEELYYGRTADQLLRLREDHIEPLIEAMHQAGVTVEELNDFLYAKHAGERNAYIATIDPNMPDGGSGMTDADAAQILADFAAAGKTARLDALARRVRTIINRTNRLQLRAGLIDQDTFDDWQTNYGDYVPLRGWEIEPEPEVGEILKTGQGYSVRGPESKAALGRTSKADGPLFYVIAQAQQAIIRAEKNRVGKALLKLVQAFPNKAVWEVKRSHGKRQRNPQTGLVEVVQDPTFRNAENAVSIKIGGKSNFVVIYDGDLATAIKNLGVEDLNVLGRFLHRVGRYFSMVNTGLNPEFVVTNFERDLQTALVHLSEHQIKGLKRNVLKSVPKAIIGVWKGMKGRTNSTWAQHYREYTEAGGKISFFDLQDIDSIKRTIDNAFGRAGPGTWASLRRGVRATGDFVDRMNASIENAIRLSTFVHLRQAGLTPGEAATAARNLTVNFNRKGEWGTWINSLYIFYNASIQGSARIAIAYKRSKPVRHLVHGMVVFGFLMDVINRWISDDDDDDRNFYDKIPQHVKERNLILMWPSFFGGKEGAHTPYPMPYGYNAFVVTGQQLGSVLFGGTTPGEATINVGKAFLNAFNPVSGGGFWQSYFVPTVLDPTIETVANTNWRGTPIQPQRYPNDRKPESENYYDSVGWVWKQAAKALNSISGGNEFRSGAIDVSPEVMEHYAEAIAGGLGRFITNSVETGRRAATGEEWLPEKTPFVRRLFGKESFAAEQNAYYDMRTDVLNAEYELKGMIRSRDREGANRVKEEYRPELSVLRTFKAVDNQITQLRETEDRVRKAPNLSESERQRRLDILRERHRRAMGHAAKVYDKARERQDGRR